MEILVTILFIIIISLLHYSNKLSKKITRMRERLIAFENKIEHEEMVWTLTKVYVLEQCLNEARQSLAKLGQMIKRKQEGTIEDKDLYDTLSEISTQTRNSINIDTDETPLKKRAIYELHHQRKKMVDSNRRLRQTSEERW